jgi:3-keto-L-gulonate-6-phosphate decarboxylase
MKKVLCLVMAMGVLAVVGCMQSKPEDAAKAFMNQQISAHQGIDLDTAGLTYEITAQTDGTAKVLVSGDIAVEAELDLVKSGGKWVVAGNAPEAGEPEEPAETGH